MLRSLLCVLMFVSACSDPDVLPINGPASDPRSALGRTSVTTDLSELKFFAPKESLPFSPTLDSIKPSRENLERLRRPRLNAWTRESNVRKMLRPIENASLNMEAGQANLRRCWSPALHQSTLRGSKERARSFSARRFDIA